MTREWKPGDVAMVPGFGVVLAGDDGYWYSVAGRLNTPWRSMPCLLPFPNVRPLVPIDPEDREAVERLRDDHEFAVAEGMGSYDAMSWALRQTCRPPKPDEPTGLGAVVVDVNGDHWTQIGTRCWLGAGRGLEGFGWGEIAAVRVLSEGVQP